MSDDAEKSLAEGDMFVTIGAWVFILMGAAIMAGGVALWFDEPNAWVMIIFGAVFSGAGFLMRRVFRTPEGKKRVVVEQVSAGGSTSIRYIHVDEDASPAAAEEAMRKWAASRLSSRPDWLEGRILSERSRSGTAFWWVAGVTGALAVAAGIGASVGDPIFWFFAGIMAIAAGASCVQAYVNGLHRRKFGTSELVLETRPGVLGSALRGEIHTGIPRQAELTETGTALLTCTRYWEERYRESDGETRRRTRSQELWRTDAPIKPVGAGGRTGLTIPIELPLPSDQPPSSPGGTSGVRWDLKIRVPMPGLDYASDFQVPVFAEGALEVELFDR